MPPAIGSANGRTTTKASSQQSQSCNPEYIIGEINAFIAIRDELLAEAEETATPSKLESLIVANNFVESVLTPARSPYEMEFLPATDAKRERKRCQQIKRRVASLRDHLVE